MWIAATTAVKPIFAFSRAISLALTLIRTGSMTFIWWGCTSTCQKAGVQGCKSVNFGRTNMIQVGICILMLFLIVSQLGIYLQQLNCYKGSSRNKKLPPRRIPTVGIVRKVPPTTNTTINKHHHHAGAIHPSYGLGLMDPPDPTQVTSSKEVSQGRLGWV